MRRLLPSTVVLAAVLAAALYARAGEPARAGETTEEVRSDDWYAVYVNGTKAGHARTRVVEVTDGAPDGDTASQWRTESDTTIVVSKGGADITLHVASRVVEDAAGRVVRFAQTQDVGGQKVATEGTVTGDRIVLDQNGVAGEVSYPEGALGPAAADRRVAEAGFEVGTEISLLAFSTDYPGEGARMTFTVGETEARTVIDRNLRLHRVSVRNQRSAARVLTMWMDGAARMHVSESTVPGIGELKMLRTTEKLAQSMTSAADVGERALVTPDRGIDAPRKTTHVVLRFSRKDGANFAANVPADAQQTVADPDESGARAITIHEARLPADVVFLERPVVTDDPEIARYLAASAYLELDDERVRDLAARAVGDVTNALLCASRIETFVRSYVDDKSLDVGFATAAEVARTRAGDCTEHAVLAAALARASGLPSRVVTGIVYIPAFSSAGVGPRGAFGYHMWTEILVADDHWLPIDAALGAFDATHVALGRSDLAATSPVAGLYHALMQAVADLRIDVVEAR